MKLPRVQFSIQIFMVMLVILASGLSLHYGRLRRQAEGRQLAIRPPELPRRSGQILLRASFCSSFEAGDQPRAGCTIVNDSSEPAQVRIDPAALVAVVLDEHGREPPLADPLRMPEGPPGSRTPPPLHVPLRGDGSANFEGWYPEDHYRLAPGRYALHWRFRDGARPEGREVRSIPASFRVLRPSRPRSGLLILTLNLGEARFEEGSPIPLNWTLRNETERPVAFRSGPAEIDLIVRDESGREMPLTAEGRRLRGLFGGGPGGPEEPMSRVRPSQAGWSVRGDGLSARYDLPPGRYTAELDYRSSDGQARSAPVSFAVVPPSGRHPVKSELIGPPAPPSYKDPETGQKVRVEMDGRTIVATGPDGVERWRRDVFAEAKLRPYRTARPVIRYLGPAREEHAGRLKARGLSGPFIGVVFNSSQFGVLDAGTGEFQYLGQD